MTTQLELAVQERAVSGKQVKQLRKKGIVPANMFGHDQPSVSLQVNKLVLQKVLAHGGKAAILLLKVDDRAGIPVLIKNVQHHVVSGEIDHVDFYRVKASEKLKTAIRLHFVNESGAASQGDVLVQRPLNEVMVECFPADLPASIQVDLSRLADIGSVIRVGDLAAGTGVTILTDHNELVAAVHLQARLEKADATDEKAETSASAGTPTTGSGTDRP